MEILFTALLALRRREKTGKGNTSILMFPIYGLAVFLQPLCRLLQGFPVLLRGLIYMTGIFGVEYASGRLLQKKGLFPWDYSRCRWNIKGVIRLDYAPLWFAAGLLFEGFLSRQSSRR